jgi:hypothetical protein
MRHACLVWLIAGCGFSSEPGPAVDDPPGGPGGSGSGSGSGVGVAPTRCDVTDASLRLCVSFGLDPMAQDLIDPRHTLIEHTDVTPLAGLVGGTAGTFILTSQLRFAETRDFDVGELTVDFWMSPGAVPIGPRTWMLDNNTQYYATFEQNGTVRCGIGGTTVTSQDVVDLAHWHHVACTYAAADQKLRVHVDGNVGGCVKVDTVPQGGHDGIAIGANYGGGKFTEQYIGGLGRLHLYARALSDQEICQIATGGTGCATQCQGQGES